MDISKIVKLHEGVKEVETRLGVLVGGRNYLLNHNTPLIDTILLKAVLAWEINGDEDIDTKFTHFLASVLSDLYKISNYKVSIKICKNEVMYWDCVAQTFDEFKVSAKKRFKKSRQCDCFWDSKDKKPCKCLSIQMVDKQATLPDMAISMLLARHIFNRRQLNLLGMPLPNKETVYSLSDSIS